MNYISDAELLGQLPVKASRHPTVFLFAPSLGNLHMPVTFPASRGGNLAQKLHKFVEKNFPTSLVARTGPLSKAGRADYDWSRMRRFLHTDGTAVERLRYLVCCNKVKRLSWRGSMNHARKGGGGGAFA